MKKWVFSLAASSLFLTASIVGGVALADSHEEVTLTANDVREAIVGRWEDAEDSASVLVYNADGTMLDEYEGEEPDTGTWEVSDDSSFVRLSVVIGGLDYDYEVIAVSAEDLSISYLARGNTLRYRRVSD